MIPIEERTIDGIASFLHEKAHDKTILIGPLVWQPSDGASATVKYVMVCTSDERKQFHCDRVFCHDEEGRAELLLTLATRRGYVIHVHDDELDMAKLAKALWPCRKINRLVQAIQKERRL